MQPVLRGEFIQEARAVYGEYAWAILEWDALRRALGAHRELALHLIEEWEAGRRSLDEASIGNDRFAALKRQWLEEDERWRRGVDDEYRKDREDMRNAQSGKGINGPSRCASWS
jgi:hypothetical protein